MILSSATRVPAASALLAALALLASGCNALLPTSKIAGRVEAPKPLSKSGVFEVGAARVDLTPIPGIPMSYSLDGKVSRGFWTRLYARAIYFEDKDGNAIVLVACEIAAIPNGLRDRVAELVRNDAKTEHLGRAQIVLAATHTHHGPQNYFSSEYYNSLPSQRAGFDPQLFEFLAGRIKTAILDAFENRKLGGQLTYRKGKLDKFFRNRSIDAFRLNSNQSEVTSENSSIDPNCDLVEDETDPLACHAVRTVVEVVDIVGAGGMPVATAVFLAAHPTVMEPDTEVFTGDLFGATSLLLEQKALTACGGYAPPVVAIFNGAEGDASITWKEKARNRVALEDFALRLAKFICGVDPGIGPPTPPDPPLVDPTIQSRFEWPFELGGRPDSDPTLKTCDPWHERCSVDDPRAGVVSMGGAQDGRTIWHEAGIRPGLRSAVRSRHGRKVVGSATTGFPVEVSEDLAPANPDLAQLPLGVYWIGNLVIATLPGEFTTMMGQRIRNALETNVLVPDPPNKHVLLIGLGNSRVSYVTTPEEFDAQHYEGGQNLFGAATGSLIQQEIIAIGTQGTTAPPKPDYAYAPGECRVFLPSDAGLPGYFADDGLEDILRDASGPKRDFQSQCWVDAIPKLSKIPDECERAVPYVWIEETKLDSSLQCTLAPDTKFLERPCDVPPTPLTSDPRYWLNGVPQDNCGSDLVTVLHGSYEDRTRWCAFWMPGTKPAPGAYSICVAGVTGKFIRQIPNSDGVPARPLDAGDSGFFQILLNRHLECLGCSTRRVCEFPEELP